jgi:hypothetical protein
VLATVAFTDIVNSTAMAASMGIGGGARCWRSTTRSPEEWHIFAVQPT